MERIIKPLDSKFLESWGFSFDGTNWVHLNYPFKLTSSNRQGTYMVILESAAIGNTPPPVENSSNLLNLIFSFCPTFIRIKTEGQKFITKTAEKEAVQKIINEYFSFDPKLKFMVMEGPQGSGISTEDEYTYTLMVGIECDIKVTYVTNNNPEIQQVDFISICPECLSYEYLSSTFKESQIKFVEVRISETEYTPFFGLGIPKYSRVKQN